METVIDTEGVRPTGREELWRHAMTDTFVPVSIGEFTEGGAHGTIGAESIGDLSIADVNASGQDIHRTQRHVNRSPAEFFQFVVLGEGVGRMSQDGRQAVLRPRDALVYETNRPPPRRS